MAVKHIEDVFKQMNRIAKKFELPENDPHMFLIENIPSGYNIPERFVTIQEAKTLPDKSKVVVSGYLDSLEIKPTKSNTITTIVGKLYKDGVSITLRWTSSKEKAFWKKRALENEIEESNYYVQVSGKIKSFQTPDSFRVVYIDSPSLSPVKASSESNGGSNANQVYVTPEPKYSLVKGVANWAVKETIHGLIENFEILDGPFMPQEVEKTLNLLPLKKSLEFMHGKRSIPLHKFADFLEFDGFRRRVHAEKVWRTVYESMMSKDIESEESVVKIDSEENRALLKEIVSKIPFTLTGDQKKAIWGILNHMASKGGTKNLLFGDVGTGKTAVALVIAVFLRRLGYQSVIMAPSGVLAKQHYDEAVRLFPDIAEDIALVTSSTKGSEKRKIANRLKKGDPMIVYGTLAVNYLEYGNLALVVVDEEQKFGVRSKELLYGRYAPMTHLLFMSATPIPRTVTGAIFASFATFRIRERPAVQKPRITKILDPRVGIPRDEISFIANALRNGNQALVVVPSIKSDDMANIFDAEKKYKEIFRGFRFAVIHGDMSQKEIDAVTQDFMDGKVDILISTTLVDTGFSNKNLSFVFIENPERFGISQLHQIRGRCGRGDKQGYCYLCPKIPFPFMKEETKQRLSVVQQSEDGFFLSQKDLEIRGSGDLLGTSQSSKGELNLLEWSSEIAIMTEYIKKQKGLER